MQTVQVHVHELAGAVVRAAGTTGAPFNIAGITGLLESFVGVFVIAGGAGILLKAHKQHNMPEAIGSIAILMIGLLIVGLALTNKINGVAQGLANVVF